jgi:LuxR family maltose regulon positive regulatory protein
LGQATAWLWQAWGCHQRGDSTGAMAALANLLPLAKASGYDWLLTRRTFAGLRNDQAAIPLLLEARTRGIEAEYAGRLLAAMGVAELEYHPGYILAVRTLGPFAVWCGDQLVDARDWKREKARQLFQLLLTYRGQWFYREQIVDLLWPHLPAEAADQNFKVALNALSRALEPGRPAGIQPFFVTRQQNVYGVNPAAKILVDADDFENLAASDDVDQLRQALRLYKDDYLPESLYEDWSSAERQRLRHLYLAAADRLARHLLRAKAWSEVIHVCQATLARDSCSEEAYRFLMHAHAAQGNRSLVHNVYQHCVATLRDELGIEPSPATRALFEKLR